MGVLLRFPDGRGSQRFRGQRLDGCCLVESLQWEMDSAKESLGHAVRQATLAGVQGRDLQLASGLTEPDLEELLG